MCVCVGGSEFFSTLGGGGSEIINPLRRRGWQVIYFFVFGI